MWGEVLVVDSIDVICVTDMCDVNLAPIFPFFYQLFILFSPGLDGGGALAMVGWQMAMCVVVFVILCCGVVVAWCTPACNASVTSYICSLYQMCAFTNLKLAKNLLENMEHFCVARFHATWMHSV